MSTEHKISRGQFLSSLGLTGLGILAACSPGPSPENPPSNELRNRLLKELFGLPERPIKAVLVDKILPYFQKKPPFTLNRSGLDLNIYRFDIDQRRTQDTEVTGELNLFYGQSLTNTLHASVGITKTKIPVPNIIKEGEIALASPEDLAPDKKTLLVSYDIHSGYFIPNGLYPKIIITSPSPEDTRINRTNLTAVESYMLIKEACTLLFADIMLEETYKRAQELGLPIKVKAQDTQGKTVDAEAITSLWLKLKENTDNLFGRTLAAVDLAGYLIALKAFEQTPTIKELAKDSRYESIMRFLPSINLGTTPHDIWERSLEQALTNSALSTLKFEYNINKIP